MSTVNIKLLKHKNHFNINYFAPLSVPKAIQRVVLFSSSFIVDKYIQMMIVQNNFFFGGGNEPPSAECNHLLLFKVVILVHKVHGLQLHNFKAILVNRSFSIQSILSQHDTVKKPVHAYARLLFLLGWNEIRSESSKRCRICNYSQMIRGNQE